MERKINKLEHSHVEVIVTVDEKTWKEAQTKAFKKQAANIEVPGFRKGKAPEHLVRAKVDQMKVMDEAINSVLPVAYREIIEQDKIIPQAQPSVEITKVSDSELEIKFVLVVAPEVKLGAYKGLKIGHESIEVSEEDVNNAIDELLKNNANLVVKDGEAKEGDTVVMDFAGSVNGELFEGGSAQNYELELGSHSFIPGFEEQLVGHKAGEHVDVNVKFPENYTPELAGKDALFACDIHEVKEKKLPELTDEFVKEELKIDGVETVEGLRAHKRAELEKQKEEQEKRNYISKLIDEIVKGSELDIAEEIIASQMKARKEDLEKRMASSGLTLEQYLQIIGQKQEDFEGQLKTDAEKDVSRYFVLEAIRKAEDLEVSDEELEFEYAKLAEQYNMKIEDVKKALENQVEGFRNELASRKVEAFLLDNNE